MHAFLIGLLSYVLFYFLFWAACSLVALALPRRIAGPKARMCLRKPSACRRRRLPPPPARSVDRRKQMISRHVD